VQPHAAARRHRVCSADGMVSFINLGPYSFVKVELLPLSPNGPYRLTIEHPAKMLVEYFDTPFEAMNRHAEIERVLTQTNP
jgi:hypothetical protein